MTTDRTRLSVLDKVGYGFGDFASNFFWQMFAIYIAKFYTDVYLLPAATMGTMLAVTRIADAVFDPMIGAVADRTRTRFGYFRPYLLWMSLPLAAAAIAAFSVPGEGGANHLVYAYVTLTALMFFYSAINIPYSALLGVLTADTRERNSVSAYRFVMAFLPIFIITSATDPMVRYFGGRDHVATGWQMAMVVYALIATAVFVVCFLMTRERVQPPARQQTTLRADLGDLGRNRPWLVLCVVSIAALTYGNIRGTVIVYYFDYVVANGHGYFQYAMWLGAACFVLGVMASAPLARYFGKKRFYMLSMAATAVLTVAFYFVPTTNVALVLAMHAAICIASAPTAPLVWSMYADTADYSEWRQGRRATGLVFSAASFSQKLGWALGGAGTGWLLAFFGYVPNVAQSPGTLHGIVLMMSLIPAVAAVVAMVALAAYELDEPTVARMESELAARRTAASAA
jgi:glycoside/pentoside/hexuronide:cation symporter, GPH family